MAERIPLYLDFAEGEIRELESTDTLRAEYLQGTKLYQYTATGSEGNSFTLAGLVDKNILGMFRATFYKRAITTVPTDTDSVKIAGTDNGSNGGILATGGVQFSAGDALLSGEILDFLYY